MRKDQKWTGLVTHASPYLLPRGSSQEQVNVQCRTPGELQSRRGMLWLSPTNVEMDSPVDVFAIRGSQGSRIMFLERSGQVRVADSLQILPRGFIGNVYEPTLAARPGQTESNYLWQYSFDGGAPENLVFSFYGGSAAQDVWQYEVTPNSCRPGARTSFALGNAEITEVRGVAQEELCRYDS